MSKKGKYNPEMRRGVHVGYCASCGCMVSDFDEGKCPRCEFVGELLVERPDNARDTHIEAIKADRRANRY